MRNLTLKYVPYALVALVGVMMAFPVNAAIEIGKPAPAIETTDIEGNAVSLDALKGKTVVLEWTNASCPFVIKHYDTNNMQAAQKKATDDGVVWIMVNSSAEGKQGHVDVEGAKAVIAEQDAHPSHVVLDASGEIGKAYGAKTTPHMYVIDADGNVAYAGAIDDNSSPRHNTVEGATNYVLAALDDLAAGNAVTTPQTAPYGCGVKY
jgi:peroxiredoxin